MGKDLQDSANKMKEGAADTAKALKNKTQDKWDEFKASDMHTDSTRSNMMLWGTAGAAAGAMTSLFVLKNASMATRLATVGGFGGLGAMLGNRYSHRPLTKK